MNIHKLLGIAIAEANNSKKSGMKYCHGAVGLYKNNIVSAAGNTRRTSWLQRLYANKVNEPNKTCEHAEVAAIRKAKEIDTLLVVRIGKNNKLLSSAPCKICRELIKDSGVRHLYYSTESEIKYECVK